MTVGAGGDSSTDGGATVVSVDGSEVLRAAGGGGDRRPGWSGGSGGTNAGSNGSDGDLANGSGESLPTLCGGVSLTPGASGTSTGNGVGAGGVVVGGMKPDRLFDEDGEGYGAGGGEDSKSGYGGVVLWMLCKEAVLLHTDAEFQYYKVPVSPGLTLLAETVVHTCEAAGMRAVCRGPSSCSYTDESRFSLILTYYCIILNCRCAMTPLETSCNILQAISQVS